MQTSKSEQTHIIQFQSNLWDLLLYIPDIWKALLFIDLVGQRWVKVQWAKKRAWRQIYRSAKGDALIKCEPKWALESCSWVYFLLHLSSVGEMSIWVIDIDYFVQWNSYPWFWMPLLANWSWGVIMQCFSSSLVSSHHILCLRHVAQANFT